MSYTLRVKGYAYEQKLVGFKDVNSFNEKVDENDDNLFYDLLDEAPEYCKELAHQYVLSGEGEVQELRELCKEEIDIVKKSIEDYSDDSFDIYDQADLLAALLSGGSQRANKHLLSYNGDAECSDREVKGYLFHKDFKSVTLL